jgi:hypothetical protein
LNPIFEEEISVEFLVKFQKFVFVEESFGVWRWLMRLFPLLPWEMRLTEIFKGTFECVSMLCC